MNPRTRALQVFDATVEKDVAAITGNLSKIMVGFVGMGFNVVMVIQVCSLKPARSCAAFLQPYTPRGERHCL